MLLILLLPALTVVGIWLFSQSGMFISSDLLSRLLGLALTYSLYFFIFICLSVYVSAWFTHSRNALLTLLAVWIIFTVIVPKTAANLGDTLYTLPSASDLKTAIQYDLDKGLDGNTPREKRMEQLKQVYLAKYRVDSIAQLPLNFEGISMQAGEEYGDKVHDTHWREIEAILNRQNNLSTYTSVLDPYIAIRNLSMALSATDFYTNLDFGRQAESYRRYLIRTMNMDMATGSKLGEFYEYKAGKHLWTSVKDFDYTLPGLSSALAHYWVEMVALLIWAFGLPLVMHLTINRFSIQ
jgi:ABC-2 type transport system permease protein